MPKPQGDEGFQPGNSFPMVWGVAVCDFIFLVRQLPMQRLMIIPAVVPLGLGPYMVLGSPWFTADYDLSSRYGCFAQ